MRFLRFLILPTIGAALLGSASAAGAQDGGPSPRDYGESGVSSGSVTVRAETGWLPVGSEGEGNGGSSCTTSNVRIVVEDDFTQPVNRDWVRIVGSGVGNVPFAGGPTDLNSSLPTFMRHFSPTGRWYEVTCDGVITVVPEGGPAINIAGLMQQALDEVDPPEPELAMTPAELHYAQLQSWLAIDPGYWVPRSAIASAGRVTVTATVTPFQADWDMGDGSVVSCDNPGTIWQTGLDDAASDCSYTYKTSSAGAAGNAYEVNTTVSFEVAVETNAPGSYGPFPNLERTTAQSVQVGEIQAVND